MDDDPGRPGVFLQWKNTDACLDFWCACGADLHFDGFFARDFTCGRCGQAWELPHHFTPQAVRSPRGCLKLVYDAQVLPDASEGAEFTLRWPQPVFSAAKPGEIVEIHDEIYLSEVASSGRAVYADLLKVQAADDGAVLTLRTRSQIR